MLDDGFGPRLRVFLPRYSCLGPRFLSLLLLLLLLPLLLLLSVLEWHRLRILHGSSL